MDENKNTMDYISRLIKNLNQAFVVHTSFEPYVYYAKVSIDDTVLPIEFPRSLIDDFEVALEKYKDTAYFQTLNSSIKFKIYIELGGRNLLPNFRVSDEIIKERREWLKAYRVNTRFDEDMMRILSEGLIILNKFFSSLLKKHPDLDLSNRKEDQRRVGRLIEYYNKNNHLNSDEAELISLQYLKAAAVGKIIDLEKRRSNEKMPSVINAINKMIYDIVSRLREDPFLDIELPQFIRDVAEG